MRGFASCCTVLFVAVAAIEARSSINHLKKAEGIKSDVKTDLQKYSLLRQKRQAKFIPEIDVETVIEALSSMDQLDCGKRYLCELATLDTDELNKEEKFTINAFKQGKSLVTDSVGRQVFQAAVNLGTDAKSMGACHTRYKLCDVGKTAVRELLKEVEKLDTEYNEIYSS